MRIVKVVVAIAAVGAAMVTMTGIMRKRSKAMHGQDSKGHRGRWPRHR